MSKATTALKEALQRGTALRPKLGGFPYLAEALRKDQAGNSTFPEFLLGAWNAGVTSYTVDFTKRTVSYYGIKGECYVEEYPEVTL